MYVHPPQSLPVSRLVPGPVIQSVYKRLATISEADILKIHEKAGRGSHRGTGVRSFPQFRKLVKDIRRDAERERPFLEIIADIFDDIERDPQPFQDCNHRTAMHLGRFIAFEFGYNLRYSGPEGEKLRRQWPEMPREELKEWISKHLFALKRD